MNLNDIVSRASVPPVPWEEGRTIPWDDPGFSRRMLIEHLSQAHDGASRRSEAISRHLDFISATCLTNGPAKILDLGCGPGLYTNQLARLGHDCVGIDFSPASVEYARAQAPADAHARFELGDIESVDFGADFDLVMLLYGELNLFRRERAVELLSRCRAALKPSGLLLLEVHSEAFVRSRGDAPASWRAAASALFSDRPHLRLDQAFWLEAERMAAGRHWIVDAASGEVSLYGWGLLAYSDAEYVELLSDAGLRVVSSHANLDGSGENAGFPVLVAAKA